MTKVVPLKRARLARMTPEERVERRTAMRLWREATRHNEWERTQYREKLRAAVWAKIEEQIISVLWRRSKISLARRWLTSWRRCWRDAPICSNR
jgi:hypothetical protein